MKTKKVAIIILATNNYFPLGIKLIHRMNYFYKGDADLTFHFVSDIDPQNYLNTDNVIFHDKKADNWNKSTVLKLDACKEIAINYDYDYIGCLDADSNIFRNFTDEEMFSDTFVVEHRVNRDGDNAEHYEKNINSSAYVAPENYQKIYYQTCYFGGSKEKMIEMVDSALKLREIDQANGIIAKWTDEAYLQIYLMKNTPTKIFNPHNQDDFPIFIDDKGNGRDSFITGKIYRPFEDFSKNEYDNMLFEISSLKNKKILWNITNNKIIIEKQLN